MYELIITEKPAASKRIADALADGMPIKESLNKVPYYKVTHGKRDIVVACAVGHLYSLAQKSGKSFEFPVFDVEWKPTSEISKTSRFSKRYLDAIKKLAKDADEVTVATDYDIEGEVIGANIVVHALKRKDAHRMKFSTLTKPDLVEAYEHKEKTLMWGQAHAGLTRHELDWYYGINTSRALTQSVKSIGRFKILSTGRVQGPALKLVVDKELEIDAFTPVPYWQVELKGTIVSNGKKAELDAWHAKDKFWDKKEADRVIKATEGKQARIDKVEKRRFKQNPPFPFDLTSLQVEAYRLFGISPKDTLATAQELYTQQFISYPRTSSQKLPAKIGFQKIIEALAKHDDFKEQAELLLSSGSLKPNEGKKTDEAHPSIYPTGVLPRHLDSYPGRIYDLIVKRFMAVFGSPATRETNTLHILCGEEPFISKGTRTVEPGWHVYYAPYVKLEEAELPKVTEGQEVAVLSIDQLAKETLPPKRFTPASLITELEKRNLGTKATRASIIDTLQQRGYVQGKALEATELGKQTCATLMKFVPKMMDVDLTRNIEEDIEGIRKGEKTPEEVLGQAKKIITDVSKTFRSQAKEIGAELYAANRASDDKNRTLGKCSCGGNLQIKKGKFGRFVGCSGYPECRTTFKLPAGGLIRPTDKVDEKTGFPMIQIIRKGKKPQLVPIHPDGSVRKLSEEDKEAWDGKPCPKCADGKLLVRKSIYGEFIGCSNYPECRFTKDLNKEK
ncbi:MAG: DNA topoisomerase I [DPANN group archaeon]|nr:DNA topoisomerase I [DPANN group archaeon]